MLQESIGDDKAEDFRFVGTGDTTCNSLEKRGTSVTWNRVFERTGGAARAAFASYHHLVRHAEGVH